MIEKENITQLTNRHPVDELADVRAKIRTLTAREETLRDIIIANDGSARVGVDWTANVVSRTSERLNTKAVIRHYGMAALAPFMRKSSFTTVNLKRRRREE